MGSKIKESKKRARRLRQQSTDAEIRLWQILRSRQLMGYKFRRQHPIGRYIADFACAEHRLIIEADGGQHNGNAYDVVRTQALNAKGWHVMRFWNNEILANTDGVAETIADYLQNHPPHPTNERDC